MSLASVMVIIAADEQVFNKFERIVSSAAPSVLPDNPPHETADDDNEPSLAS